MPLMAPVLPAQLAEQLAGALERLVEDGDLSHAALIRSNGETIQSTGLLPEGCRAAELAARGSAIFSRDSDRQADAGRDMSLLREDQPNSLYLQLLDGGFLLLAVGGQATEAGLVRLAARLHASTLESLCRHMTPGPETANRPTTCDQANGWPATASRLSTVTAMRYAEDHSAGSSLRLDPGDIDIVSGFASRRLATCPGENTDGQHREDARGPFDRVFSGMLTTQTGSNAIGFSK